MCMLCVHIPRGCTSLSFSISPSPSRSQRNALAKAIITIADPPPPSHHQPPRRPPPTLPRFHFNHCLFRALAVNLQKHHRNAVVKHFAANGISKRKRNKIKEKKKKKRQKIRMV